MGEVAVNGGPAHAEQLADFGHGFVLLQIQGLRRLGFGEGFFRQAFGPPALTPPGPGGGQAGFGSFADDVALKLGQRGEEVKHEPALGRGRVQVVVQAHEVDALFLKTRHQQDQVFQRAAQPVKLPDHERIAGTQPGQQQLELRPVFGRRRFFLHDVGASGGLQGVDLQVQLLVLGTHAGIANFHGQLSYKVTAAKIREHSFVRQGNKTRSR